MTCEAARESCVLFLKTKVKKNNNKKKNRTLGVAGLAAIAHSQITSKERGGGLQGPGRRSGRGNVGRGWSMRSAESGGRSAGVGGGRVGG